MNPDKWPDIRLGDLIEEYRVKSTVQDQHEVFTSSRNGLVPQSEYYGDGRIALRDNIGFHVIPPLYMTYRSRSDDGNFYIYKNDLGRFGVISHFYPVFRFKDHDDQFFLDFLNFNRSKLGKHSVGSSQKVLSLNALKNIVFPLPPRSERIKIAEILSTWDCAIETMDALLVNAQAQKSALMRSLLTATKRLRGFSDPWTQQHFGDAVNVDQDSLGQATPADYRFRYISLSDVGPGKIADHLVEMDFGTSPSRARRKLKSGDILMATVRPNLQAFAKVSDRFADCIASTGFAVLRAKAGFHPDYIYHYLFSDHLTGQIEALVVGSNYPAINSSDIKGMAMHCPSYDEQAAIAAALTDAERLISQYLLQATVLRQEKSALMQQLLTGKRRVKVDEREDA